MYVYIYIYIIIYTYIYIYIYIYESKSVQELILVELHIDAIVCTIEHHYIQHYIRFFHYDLTQERIGCLAIPV